MPRRGAPPPSRRGRVVGSARRLWPVAIEVWRRWDNLTPQQQERYRRMAADYARRGREALATRQRRTR